MNKAKIIAPMMKIKIAMILYKIFKCNMEIMRINQKLIKKLLNYKKFEFSLSNLYY
jgi:hypothetical protein